MVVFATCASCAGGCARCVLVDTVDFETWAALRPFDADMTFTPRELANAASRERLGGDDVASIKSSW
jgi:hypothetical protein